MCTLRLGRTSPKLQQLCLLLTVLFLALHHNLVQHDRLKKENTHCKFMIKRIVASFMNHRPVCQMNLTNNWTLKNNSIQTINSINEHFVTPQLDQIERDTLSSVCWYCYIHTQLIEYVWSALFTNASPPSPSPCPTPHPKRTYTIPSHPFKHSILVADIIIWPNFTHS